MQPARLRLGQLLVDAHILTVEQLEQVLAVQKTDARKLGALLVESGVITETQLTQVLSQQLSVPWISLHHIDFSRELLNRIPRELAEKFCLVPIYVRAVRGQGNTLYIAMEDPMQEEALSECASASGLPVRAMIAAPADIRKAVRLYYTASTAPASGTASGRSRPPSDRASRRPSSRATPARADESSVASAPVGAAPAVPASAPQPPAPSARPARPPSIPSAALPKPRSLVPPARPRATPADDDTPELEVHEIEIPLPRKRSQVRMTLLDGTQINVPNSRRRSAEAPAVEEELSVAELMAALRAAAHGADDVLGANMRWERLMAALLSLLMKKHLVFERELLEELKKI